MLRARPRPRRTERMWIPPPPAADDEAAPLVQRTTTVEVNGKRFDVKMWVPDVPMVAAAAGAPKAKKPAKK